MCRSASALVGSLDDRVHLTIGATEPAPPVLAQLASPGGGERLLRFDPRLLHAHSVNRSPCADLAPLFQGGRAGSAGGVHGKAAADGRPASSSPPWSRSSSCTSSPTPEAAAAPRRTLIQTSGTCHQYRGASSWPTPLSIATWPTGHQGIQPTRMPVGCDRRHHARDGGDSRARHGLRSGNPSRGRRRTVRWPMARVPSPEEPVLEPVVLDESKMLG